MRDLDIRKAIHDQVFREHKNDPSTIIINELGIRQGTARVDIAVVNSRLHGYEIKSAHDDLRRLSRQTQLYSEVFDHITLVVTEQHADEVLEYIPEWWELMIAVSANSDREIQFELAREGKNNPEIIARSLAEFLWRDEALAILRQKKAAKGYLSKPRSAIWDRLCEVCDLPEIQELVRAHLKTRVGSVAAQSRD